MRTARAFPAALALFCTLISVWREPALAQPAQRLETPSGTVAFENGVLVSAQNRLTGETYTIGRAGDQATGILRPADQTQWLETAVQQTPTSGKPSEVRSEVRWGDGSVLTTVAEAAPATGDFTIRQTGQSSTPKVWGCQWGIGGLSDAKVTLIVPAWSGVQLGRSAPFREGVFDWPTTWEAQMLIVQGARGGMWIHADDPDDRFKGVSIRHRAGLFDLGFRTYNEGPLESRKTVESVTWRVGFYQGDWRVPARQFRDWMARTAGLTPTAKRQPAWADKIRSVIILPTGPTRGEQDATRAVLTKLMQWVTPAKTLLYTPNWRRDGYDLNYPDYTAQDGFKELVNFAHQLGYRVMPHTCYYGASTDNPDYGPLKPYHLRDLFTGELITYTWPFSDPVPHIAMLHPGAKAWRELYVQRCQEAVRRYGVDAFHLDVTLVMPNVTERVDGLNTIQGNVAFHRDLLAALPEVGLGGEGLNEVTCRHEAFAQTHGLFAVNVAPGGPNRIADDSGVDCSHPISAYLLSPFTRWYGYLGYTPPDSSPLYRGWTRAYESWGVTPTLSSPTLAALEHPQPDLRARLEEMRLVDHYDLQPDFDTPSAPETKCVWRGREGAKLVYERDGFGGSYAWFADGKGAHRTIYRYLRGRTTFQGEGNIGPWVAFDGNGLYGLDPDRTYLCMPEPPRSDTPHLLRLPEGVIARGLRCTEDFMLFDLATKPPIIDLKRHFAEARVGIVVDGREQPLGSGAQFLETVASCGGQTKDGLFAHPPWDVQHGVTGDVFAEWTVKVPGDGKPALSFSFGLRDGAEKADGVTFTVAVDGQTLLRKNWKRCEWLPCRADLSPYAGREVKLRLSVTKGPEGRGSFPWAIWGEPKVITEPSPRLVSIGLLAPAKGVAAAGPAAQAAFTFVDTAGKLCRHRVETQVPGATCLFFRKPQPVALPLDLRTMPFTWTPMVDGLPIPGPDRPAYLTAVAGEGRSGGEARPALITHPPIAGSTTIDYLLTLPASKPAQLRFSTAIQDGAKGTNGVAFLVAINGQVAWTQKVIGPDGWHPGSVDLKAYAGETVVLSLIVDAMGDATCDWARWGEPRIEAQ